MYFILGADEMDSLVRVLAAKADNLSLVPRTHRDLPELALYPLCPPNHKPAPIKCFLF